MKKYETLYVVAPTLTEEEVKGVIEKVKGVIENGGGVVENIDEWGKRRLAYEINKVNEGYYVLMNFSANNELPKELDRVLRISDNIIRHLVVKLD
ncbi:SSU ribosomal protein S6P [Caloramator quimbayensis]|uniref:Small ribosomal subunit protein bS6 n=1 Tax=Caloramator quimbayensis TaxID=1147123 RepID=A0A1T4Y892_9CLOT|nr:30S ribosomal protein S6 [Caloramator quimbayensis]SKA97505.1 SSU ribosomal protein S6P [Caloramator quimbayensis]